MLLRGDRVLVAVSGGPDSVALLHVLHALRAEFALHLEVAHLQHGLRGEDAKGDACFVEKLATKLDCPFHLKEINLPRMKSAAGKGNIEALARAERYRFFADVARARRLGKIATAHTLDDQAETALMWFLRGAGSKGLGGIAPFSPVAGESFALIRPFLEISKAEILGYLKEKKIEFRTDATNSDPGLLRNWLRLELLPILQERLDSRLPARLAQQAEIFREENLLLDRLARDGFAALWTESGIDRIALLAQPKSLQRRILRLWMEQVRGNSRGLDFVHIDDALRLISAEAPQGRVAVPGGHELVREYDRLRIDKQVRGRQSLCYDYPLEFGKMLAIPEAGLEFRSEPAVAPFAMPENLMEAVFDAAWKTTRLSVRNFRHGDRFQPLGMKGHKKVKDLFMERRLPLSLRARWPLLVAGDEIVWIPGYGRSAAGCVSDATKHVWRITAGPIQG